MVTHDSVAASYSQRVVFLADGSVVSVPEQPTPDASWERGPPSQTADRVSSSQHRHQRHTAPSASYGGWGRAGGITDSQTTAPPQKSDSNKRLATLPFARRTPV